MNHRQLAAMLTSVIFFCAIPALAGITLDPNNPLLSFQRDGSQGFTTGPALLLNDNSSVDHIGFFAPDPDAATGKEVDLSTTFRVVFNTALHGVDTGVRFIINDGATTSAIAACVDLDGNRGIAIATGTDYGNLSNYAGFVAVDWTAPVALKFRRSAAGDAEILEINGVPPAPRSLVAATSLPAPVQATPSVGFGCFSDPAVTTAEFTQFSSQAVGEPAAGTLTFTRLRIRDSESTDRLRFRADYTLGTGTNGIDPSSEPVTLKLSSTAGVFYTQTLNGFSISGQAPRRRWTLNDAERTRTGIEQMVIDEDPNNTGGIFLRDTRTDPGTGDYSTVMAEIVIGTGAAADKLTGSAMLVQKPAGSGSWRLMNEP